jgi:hypothetical protein
LRRGLILAVAALLFVPAVALAAFSSGDKVTATLDGTVMGTLADGRVVVDTGSGVVVVDASKVSPQATPTPTPTVTATPTPTPTATPPSTGETLSHDPSFIDPTSYYARFSNGPSTSKSYFPILAYQMNLGQWSGLPARVTGMGVNGIYYGYDGTDQNNFNIAAANGLKAFISGSIGSRSNGQVVDGYAMYDEPNQDASPYRESAGTPSNDVGANKYIADANAYRSRDSTRPVVGNFTKDVFEWAWPASGWSTSDNEAHMRRQLGSLDITSADVYGWTDNWEWDQSSGNTGTNHIGAWVYGHMIDRLQYYNPNSPAYGFVEGVAAWGTPPTGSMTPNMIETAVWNLLAHGAQGWTYWPRDFYHNDDQPYSGATYTGEYSLFGDHQWDTQYARAKAVDADVKSNATALNSPTVSGISATGQNGVPVTALGKDIGDKLWLLAQADGDSSHPLSNTTSMTGTVTVPNSVPVGSVFDVLGENRSVSVDSSHHIVDTYGTTTEKPLYSSRSLTYGYAHHIYQQR